MRKAIGFISVAAAAVFALAAGNDLLKASGKALSDASSLTADYTLQRVGEPAISYKVALAKPNRARIETPNEIIVADGKQITRYSRKDNAYFKSAQSDGALKSLFANDDLMLWRAFFVPNAMDAIPGESKGTVTRRGQTLDVVKATMDAAASQSVTYYLSQQDKVARQAVFTWMKGGKEENRILNATNVTVGGSLSDSTFAFVPPADSREVSAAEMNADRWYFDLDEAKAVAARTGKKIFVDFFATWCGPCKRLAADVLDTESWKPYSKYFVFLRIDVDAQPAVSRAYNIEAMPTQMVLDKDGAVLGKTVGYGNPEMFFSWINKYAN